MKRDVFTVGEFERVTDLKGYDNLPGGFFICKVDDPYSILYANNKILLFFECDNSNEFYVKTGGTLKGIVHESEFDSVLSSVDAQIKSSEDQMFRINYHIVTKNGTIKYLNSYGKLERDAENGPLLYVFAVETNVDEYLFEKDQADSGAELKCFFQYTNNVFMSLKSASYSLLYSIIYVEFTHLRYFNVYYGIDAKNDLQKKIAAVIYGIFKGDCIAHISEDHYLICAESEGLIYKLEQAHDEMSKIENAEMIRMKSGIYHLTKDDISTSVDCDLARFACEFIRNDFDRFYCVYKPGLEKTEKFENYILDNIDSALESGQIEVYYQPIIRTLTGRVSGVEALARWNDPQKGFILPVHFISALENNGISYKIDNYMIDKVAAGLRKQIDEGQKIVPVSVNISRSDFAAIDPVKMVVDALEKYSLRHDLINVEISERAVTEDQIGIMEAVNRFHEANIKVVLDDYGSGYSSLNVLRDFDFDEIKIDMDLLHSMGDRAKTIVLSTIKMAKELGVHTLAEGVETEEQLKFLKSVGCEKIQGYYYSEPQSMNAFYQHLADINIPSESKKISDFYDEVGLVDIMSNKAIALVIFDGIKFKRIYANAGFLNIERSVLDDLAESRPTNKYLSDFPYGLDVIDTIYKAIETGVPQAKYFDSAAHQYVFSFTAIASCEDKYMFMITSDVTRNVNIYGQITPNIYMDVPIPYVVCRPVLSEDKTKAVDMEYVFVNRQYAEKAGKTVEELVGKTYLELYPDSDKHWIELPYQALVNNKIIKTRLYGKALNGWSEFTAMPVSIPGCCAYIFYDIEGDISEKAELTKNTITDDVIISIAKILNSDHEYNDVLNDVLNRLKNVVRGDRILIMEVMDKSVNNTFECCSEGVPSMIDTLQAIPYDEVKFISNKFTKKNQSIVINDIEKLKDIDEEMYNYFQDNNIIQYIAFPFYCRAELMGYLCVINPNPMKDIDAKRLFETVSFFIGAFISNYRYQQQINFDALTKVNNRNAFIDKEEYLMGKDVSVGIVMADLNGLKEINDNGGHMIGDKFIKETADFLAKFYGRKNVYRTGGDEFAVLTIDITAEKFEENRDKIVEILAQEKGPNISIGFEWCSSASDLKWCVKKADDMMYKNKQSYYTKHDRRKRHI